MLGKTSRSFQYSIILKIAKCLYGQYVNPCSFDLDFSVIENANHVTSTRPKRWVSFIDPPVYCYPSPSSNDYKMPRSTYTEALLGQEVYKKVRETKVLVVGAGGIGCELRRSAFSIESFV